MKKLLITGFEPFGGEKVNASALAVSSLPDCIGSWELIKREIPVVFGRAAACVIAEAEKLGADAVLCVGQAGGRERITPEYIGINFRSASIPDNDGCKPDKEPCIPGGPDGIFTTMPVHKMASAVSERGIPCAVSYSAGTYVCNDTLYTVLNHFGSRIPVGFIHIPLLPQQATDGRPFVELEKTVEALTIAIGTLE